MLRVLLIVAVVLLTIYAVVEVAQMRSSNVRTMPSWLWAVAVICLPVVGPLLWFIFGRPRRNPRPRPKGPDDDPNFLRGV